MPLPLVARQRLAAGLRPDAFSNIDFRASNSLPLPANSWAAHTAALKSAVTDFATVVPEIAVGYEQCRQDIEQAMSHAARVVSHLLAIQPFAPFDRQAAERLLGLVQQRLRATAAAIEKGINEGVDDSVLAAAERCCTAGGSSDARGALCEAFAMPDPPIDEAGNFRPEWVLGHYAYRTNDLLSYLLPHLVSLGVPWLTDVLAAVTAVGEVLSCSDPVTAYVEMDAMIRGILAADGETSSAVRHHLTLMEPAIRRARGAAARSSQAVRNSDLDTEARANALADCYKRLVEGPFRQFVWAHFCLSKGIWHEPPTLGPLRDRLVAAGGGLAALASVIIPDLRNGEAHETLIWDGFSEQFLSEGVQISLDQVVASAELAHCVIAGYEAGLTAVRLLELPNELQLLPDRNENGRMPRWRRVQAFFGTNRLRLLEASLNTRHAFLRVEHLGLTDVNPCFQALVLSRRLMPEVETFSVSEMGGEAIIAVSADALTANMPAWELAVSNLDQIPLSTFMPANLDARRRHEDPGVAIRSVAWIAVDDTLGIIDGSADIWDDAERALIETRLRIVQLAISCTNDLLVSDAPRLRSVAGSVASLRQWVVDDNPSRPELADRRDEISRLRLQWKTWGPVLRHPLVAELDTRDPDERQPRIRDAPKSLAFQLL